MQTNSTRERSTGTSILTCQLGGKTGAELSGNSLVIQERGILLRIEHLQKRTRRVTIMPSADLVHLIDEDKRVLRRDFLKSLDGFTGHGTSVSV